ncbi:MAG: hypothetical protein WB622_07195 [Acidobacteriaceae bacterium]
MDRKAGIRLSTVARVVVVALMAAATCLAIPASAAQKTKSVAKPAVKAPAKPAAATHGATSAAHAKPGGEGNRPGAPGARNAGGRTNTGPVRNRDGSTTTRTARGGEMTRRPDGRPASFKGANGHEARFDSRGHVREVHGNGMSVSRGPRGMRRTVVDRPDHSRMVAYGHGRGYIQRPYSYRGRTYYSRAYYRHGGYYRAYYHPYYYHGVYLHGYMPAYYYPPAYYGWAYNPWPAPVPYAWGWGGNPWYGYYGAYFAPYPVYPSAAYWLADYMISTSLAEAYAAGVAAGAAGATAQVRRTNAPHLVFASYDPDTGTTSPTMTKEVKDAVSQEISRELAASQKAQDPSDGSTASLATLLADGQPHVFVANAGLTVTSAGEDCGLTEGDVLQLSTPPAEDASAADLRVLASKQADCPKDSTVSVDLTDLQEMHNSLLANIDSGMAQMKDHPGQGGLPAPPATATQGTTEAPYAAAAPAADPNGAAELDQQSEQGAQLEQQVTAEATAPDSPEEAASPAPAAAPTPAAPARPPGPVTIALGQTPDEVTASKGQPLNVVKFPKKTIFIYSDMKIIFVNGKVSDVQ